MNALFEAGADPAETLAAVMTGLSLLSAAATLIVETVITKRTMLASPIPVFAFGRDKEGGGGQGVNMPNCYHHS